MHTQLVVRHRRSGATSRPLPSPSGQSRDRVASFLREDDTFLLEWEVVRYRRSTPISIYVTIEVTAQWCNETICFLVNKSSDDIFALDRQKAPISVSLSTKKHVEFVKIVEDFLKQQSIDRPAQVLQLMEVSRWTFASQTVYDETNGPKLKEGGMEKASGGYERYNRSRSRVLLLQCAVITVCIVGFILTNGHGIWLTSGILGITVLSFAHWTYFRLNAIDATCILPCLFFPPVGPILIFVWTVFTFFFEKRDYRWFVLRQGHLEMYEAWSGPSREPVGVFLLDRNTLVGKSKLYPRQFYVSTPYRTLRLWAPSRSERNDWIDKIQKCIEIERAALHAMKSASVSSDGYVDIESGRPSSLATPLLSSSSRHASIGEIESSFAPRRERVECEMFIDGKDYFNAVYKAIEGAKKEVFIAGWMISPELYLHRASESSDEESETVLPINNEEEGSLFISKLTKPHTITIEHDRWYEYTFSPCVTISGYDIVGPAKVSGDRVTPIGRLEWVVQGRFADVKEADWVTIDLQNFDVSLLDAQEPLRFQFIEKSECFLKEIRFSFRPKHEQIVPDEENSEWVSLENGSAEGYPLGGVRLVIIDSGGIENSPGNDSMVGSSSFQKPALTPFQSSDGWHAPKKSDCEDQTMVSSQVVGTAAGTDDHSMPSARPGLSGAERTILSSKHDDASGLNPSRSAASDGVRSMKSKPVNVEEDESSFMSKIFSMVSRTQEEAKLDRLNDIFVSAETPPSVLRARDPLKLSSSTRSDRNSEESEDSATDSTFGHLRNVINLFSSFAPSKQLMSQGAYDNEDVLDLDQRIPTEESDALQASSVQISGGMKQRPSVLDDQDVGQSRDLRTPGSANKLKGDFWRLSESVVDQSANSLPVETVKAKTSTARLRGTRCRADILTSRLDRLIARKVLDGVRFHILMYRDVELFLPNASSSAKKKLLTKALFDRNLQVMRHAPEGRTYGSIQHWLTCSMSRGKTWWSHHEKLVCVDQSIAFVGGLDLAFGRFDSSEHRLTDRSSRTWYGKDFYNPFHVDFHSLDRDPLLDSLDRHDIDKCRMPWHDVSASVNGAAAVDVARHFIGRWNAVKRELKTKDPRFTLLVPRYPSRSPSSSPSSASSPGLLAPQFTGTDNIGRINLNTDPQVNLWSSPHGKPFSPPLTKISPRMRGTCQVVRSVAPWSSFGEKENSILEAYVELISGARESIYIEQQFFSSDLAGKPVRNIISRVLAERIIKAIKHRERFRCIVVLPVLPAFEGSLRNNYSARSVVHWNLRTIRGLMDNIKRETGLDRVPEDVLGFYSLRKIESVRGAGWTTEQVYVHSKVLVVDDQVACVGSANLNDRSMLGSRDSEIALVIANCEFPSVLRKRLFAEHLGLNSREEVEVFDARWTSTAIANTRYIKLAFPFIPDDRHQTFDDVAKAEIEFKSRSSVLRLSDDDVLSQVRGTLIQFPTSFLINETSLLPRVVRLEREGAVPFENFT